MDLYPFTDHDVLKIAEMAYEKLHDSYFQQYGMCKKLTKTHLQILNERSSFNEIIESVSSRIESINKEEEYRKNNPIT